MKPKIKKGDKIIILPNLVDVMHRLGFDEDAIERCKSLIGTTHTVFAVWTDESIPPTDYVTVDLCVEIPSDCCELVNL